MEHVFFQAIQAGDASQVAELIATEPALLSAKTANGTSGVLWAVYTDQLAMAHYLIEHGAPITVFEAAALGLQDALDQCLNTSPERVNAVSADGFTALGLAAFFGQYEAAVSLLAHGAQPNLASQNAQRVTPLHAAVAHQHTRIVQLLIAHGANVDALQEQDFTPLQEASHNGSVDIVQMLLAAGAMINLRNQLGKTALTYARQKGDERTIAVLIQHGGTE